jgi:hypothetical protein
VRFHQIIASAGLALTCALAPAHAEKRVGLVVGNDRYVNLPPREQLQKAVNDARAVGGSLRSIGFEVIAGENLDRRALVGKLDEMTQRNGTQWTEDCYHDSYNGAPTDGSAWTTGSMWTMGISMVTGCSVALPAVTIRTHPRRPSRLAERKRSASLFRDPCCQIT